MYFPLYGGEQHDVDEHRDFGNMHSEFPEEPRPCFGDFERLRRIKHRNLHRRLLRAVRRRSRQVPDDARRRPVLRLPRRHYIPPRDPAVEHRRRGERRDEILRRNQRHRRNHRFLLVSIRRVRCSRPPILANLRRNPPNPTRLASVDSDLPQHEKPHPLRRGSGRRRAKREGAVTGGGREEGGNDVVVLVGEGAAGAGRRAHDY